MLKLDMSTNTTIDCQKENTTMEIFSFELRMEIS